MPEFGDLAARAAELATRVLVAGGVITAFVVAGRLASPLVRMVLDRRKRPSYTRVFSALFRVGVAVVGSLFALTLAFPSVRVADVLAIFGIVSVAAGFAFKDSFENLLAGVLLLLRDPFKSGDQVVIAGREGTVEGVTVRETLLRGHDGHRYFVPNASVMTDVIDVATHGPALRQSFTVRVAAEADLDAVRATIRRALASVADSHAEPPPAAVLVAIDGGDVEIECRFWSGSTRAAATAARDAAIAAVAAALQRDDMQPSVDELRIELSHLSEPMERDTTGGSPDAATLDGGAPTTGRPPPR